jgi:hypothetical protein
MRRCGQSWYRSKNAKRRRENILRRSRKGVLAREAKRLANPAGREPKLVPFYPLDLGVRDKLSGDTAFVDLRSGRDAARRIAVILKFYQPSARRRILFSTSR